VTLEKSNLQANGQGLAYALVEIVDKEGRRVPFGDYKVKAEVSGAGTLAALGTGRPITEENYTSGEFTSYLGRLQAIVRAGYEAGEAELKVSAEGLGQANATISIKGE
jgi:beta-galactosidase